MKTAVVLSGGGAKGAFQVGAMKKLTEKGVTVDAFYGTSVGAINAATFAYQGAAYAEENWLKITGQGDVLSFNWSTLLGLSTGIYNLNPLKKSLQKALVGTPTATATVCKVNILTGEIVFGQSGDPDFLDSVLQSATIPFVMSPINNFGDGGMREQTPLRKCVEDGYTNIIAILCNPMTDLPDPAPAPTGLFKMVTYGMQAIDMLEHEVFVTDLDRWTNYTQPDNAQPLNITWYAPDKLLIDTLEFDPVKIKAAMQQGYDAVT